MLYFRCWPLYCAQRPASACWTSLASASAGMVVSRQQEFALAWLPWLPPAGRSFAGTFAGPAAAARFLGSACRGFNSFGAANTLSDAASSFPSGGTRFIGPPSALALACRGESAPRSRRLSFLPSFSAAATQRGAGLGSRKLDNLPCVLCSRSFSAAERPCQRGGSFVRNVAPNEQARRAGRAATRLRHR